MKVAFAIVVIVLAVCSVAILLMYRSEMKRLRALDKEELKLKKRGNNGKQ